MSTQDPSQKSLQTEAIASVGARSILTLEDVCVCVCACVCVSTGEGRKREKMTYCDWCQAAEWCLG